MTKSTKSLAFLNFIR